MPGDKFRINSDLEIKILSPSSEEERDFINANFNVQGYKSAKSPRANLLSAVLLLLFKGDYALLTSDVEIKSLKRIDSLIEKLTAGRRLLIGQSPLHGSDKNHSTVFWRNRNKIENVRIVISCDSNSQLHPGRRVLKDFPKLNYILNSTNIPKLVKEKNQSSASLDLFSRVTDTLGSNGPGDQVFSLEKIISSNLVTCLLTTL